MSMYTLLLVAIVVTTTTAATTANNGTGEIYYTLDGTDFFELRVLPNEDNSRATYTLTLQAEAWISVGFADPDNSGNQMVGPPPSWAVSAFDDDGDVYMAGVYSLNGFARAQFSELNLDIGNLQATQDFGISTLVFDLPFGTGGQGEPIYGADNSMIFAYGPGNNFNVLHPFRAARVVDFLTSDDVPEPVFACSTQEDCSGFNCLNSICRCPFDQLGQDCSVPATGSSCPEGEPFCVATVIEEDYARVGLSMQTTGWMSLCYDTAQTSGMVDGDCWIFNLNPFTGGIISDDAWTTVVGVAPVSDTQQDLEQVAGYLDEDGTMIVSFRRKLDTGDEEFDHVIVEGALWSSWALGPEDGMTLHTVTNRGRFELDMFTADIIVLGPPSKSQNFVPLVAVVILVLIAITLKFVPQSGQHEWWFKRIGDPVKPSLVHTLTLDAWPTLMDLTYAEAFVMCVYVVTLATFIAVSVHNGALRNNPFLFTTGHLCQMHLAMLFLPITRNSIWLYIFGISFERGVKFHRWLGRLFFFFLIFHLIETSFSELIDFSGAGFMDTADTVEGSGVAYGFMAFLVFFTMGVFTLEYFRRFHFEVFFYTHLMFPVGLAFAIAHNTDMWFWLMVPLALYIADRCIRFVRSHRSAETIRAEVLGTEKRITRLTLRQNGFKFEGGDYVFLQIPEVSFDEWHPFSLSNAPNDGGVLGFHILESGKDSWTQRLANMVSAGRQPMVYVDGPHGKLTVDVHQYGTVFLIAGGVGITPIMSTLGQIARDYKNNEMDIVNFKIHVIWSNQQAYPFRSWFNSFINSESIQNLIKDGKLTFHFYATRMKQGRNDVETGDTGGKVSKVPTELRTKDQMGDVPDVEVVPGRPNMMKILKDNKGVTSCAIACGPAPLVASAQQLCGQLDIHFHKETFAL